MKKLASEKILFILFLFGIGIFLLKNINFSRKPKNALKLIASRKKSFSMGNPDSKGWDQAHRVTFTYNFYIDSTEVTQKEYDSLMKKTYHNYTTPEWSKEFGLGDTYPVYNVTWFDAVLFCNAKSKAEGLDTAYTYGEIYGTPGNGCHFSSSATIWIHYEEGYRLPTEAEWEYACRGGRSSDYFWGSDSNPQKISQYAVWAGDGSKAGTKPVATKRPNAFKLYDMSGNVNEWCHDLYRDYGAYSRTNPIANVAFRNAIGSLLPFINKYGRVFRGGSWYSGAKELTSHKRVGYGPAYKSNKVGFRVVRRRWELWEKKR